MLLKRPITAIMLILAVLIFGGIALSNLSVSLLPQVATPSLMVRTDWNGAAPREVEKRINKRLEGVLGTVQGVQHIHGFARQGQSIISLQFKWGQNMDLAFLNVREKLDKVRSLLPRQASRPQLVHNGSANEPIAVLGITAANKQQNSFSQRLSLKRWASQVLTRRLEEAKGIAQAVLVGGVTPEVKIRYRPQAINRYGLSLNRVQSLVHQTNIFTAAGQLRSGWYRYSLKIQSRIQSIDDIRQVPLKTLGNGKILTLSDVAKIKMGAADPTSFALADGHRVLSVLVKKAYGTNTVQVYHSMLPLLKQLRRQNPDINIQVLSQNASYISSTIHSLLRTLLFGAILAFIVLFLFLDDYRTPFTIGVSIPVSIFLTFFVMYLSNIQLNIISLSGLTLGIGLLVDNAIIVLENINQYRREGYGVLEAAAQGTKEIALAVTASTFTTISVFLPLVFLGGFEGAFFKDQAWTLSISLLASLIVALLILPVLVVQVQKREQTDGTLGFNRYFNRIRDLYEQSLQRALRHRGWLLAGIVLLAGLAAFEFLMINKNILPQSAPSQVRYRVRLPGNTALRSTRTAAIALTRQLPHQKDDAIQALGGYTDQTSVATLSKEGPNKFTLTVPVKGRRQADSVRSEVATFLHRRPGWSAKRLQSNTALGMLPAAGAPPVIFRLVGKNRNRSQRLVPLLQKKLDRIDSSITLQKQYRQQVQTYHLQFKPARLIELGLTENEVVNYLKSLTRGQLVTNWDRQDEKIAIRLEGADRTIYDPRDIRLDMNGKEIPLAQVVSIKKSNEPEQLERVNQTPVLSYTANLGFGEWWWDGKKIKKAAGKFARQTGIEVKMGGAVLNIVSLLEKMGLLLGISVIIIYIILAIQFESLKHPLIILCAVPFAWVGSLTALWLTGVSLNALSFMGILILTGIAVNDAILKVDFMRRFYEETGDLNQAIRQAGLNRFRPVVMTSLTTIFGLIPMLLPLGTGYAFRLSLALSLMGGMITSTGLTLYLIPMIFQWVEG